MPRKSVDTAIEMFASRLQKNKEKRIARPAVSLALLDIADVERMPRWSLRRGADASIQSIRSFPGPGVEIQKKQPPRTQRSDSRRRRFFSSNFSTLALTFSPFPNPFPLFPGLAKLEAFGNVDVALGLTPEQLNEKVKTSDALIIRSATQVTADVFAASGGRLKVVGRAGVGVDNVDLKAATAAGCLVVNAPTAKTVAAAEHGIALLAAVARNVAQADASIKEGKWERSKFVGVSMVGKTLAIIGFGKVGSEVGRRGKGLGFNVVAYDPYASEAKAAALGVKLVSFDEALATGKVFFFFRLLSFFSDLVGKRGRRSKRRKGEKEKALTPFLSILQKPSSLSLLSGDFFSLHMPMTPETKGLFGDAAFAKMKKGARVVNVARGGVIDDDALVKALDAGIVAAAALDVFEKEPPPSDHPLTKRPDVVCTPHLGASTAEAQDDVGVEIAEAVIEALQGKLAATAVNAPMVAPEVLAELAPFVELAKVRRFGLGSGGGERERNSKNRKRERERVWGKGPMTRAVSKQQFWINHRILCSSVFHERACLERRAVVFSSLSFPFHPSILFFSFPWSLRGQDGREKRVGVWREEGEGGEPAFAAARQRGLS